MEKSVSKQTLEKRVMILEKQLQILNAKMEYVFSMVEKGVV